jgi:hypothetical protein
VTAPSVSVTPVTANVSDTPAHMPDSPPPPPSRLHSIPPEDDIITLLPLGSTLRSPDEYSEEEDDDVEEGRGHISDARARSFYPFKEDVSVPDSEELRIMRSYIESSALDDKHWQTRTFFDLQDPEIVPGESGMIEWTVENFNGTKENPRKNLLLTSHTVQIAGHEWRIKLLPHGHMNTDRLSLYVENVSIQSLPPEEWSADELPLPVLGDVKVMKRRAVAAQMSIILYNPEEPRVNEFRADAHHFFQDSPDHGWTRFTSLSWYEIHRRSYAQRQPLLRNDKLAIKAFIRVIDDPTGCLWASKESAKMSETALAITSLSPFYSGFEDSAICPVLALWLHLRPFRQLIYQLGSINLSDPLNEGDDLLPVLQAMLWRMRSRHVAKASPYIPLIQDYLEDVYESMGPQDAVHAMHQFLDEITTNLKHLEDMDLSHNILQRLSKLFGTTGFSGERLTKQSIAGKSSMQEIVDEGLPAPLLESDVLTLELERQVFDSTKRVWKKLLHKVRLDDRLTVGNVTYTLYGFVAHEGHLRNGKYSSYFRPGGIGGLWYSYKHAYPTCHTQNQAPRSKEGSLPMGAAAEEPIVTSDRLMNFDPLLGQTGAIAYVVLYVRDDVDAFNLAAKEPWDVPQWIPAMFDPEHADPTNASEGAFEVLSYEENTTTPRDDDQEMNDATEGSIMSKSNEDDQSACLRQTTINYLSQPYYSGTVNAADEYHGHGHLIYLNGDEYTGNFQDSLRSGQGTMTYANNDTYTGAWANNQPHGHGTHTESRTGNVYTGNWEEGKRSGVGTTHWKCSDEESKLCRICYVGEADAAFYDCGHVVACVGCARRVEDCPVCRRRVRDVVRLYYLA